MILLALSLAIAGEAFDPSAYYDHPPRKEMRARVEACGLDQVSVVKNKAKREVVRVEDTEASDDELICAAKVIDKTFYGDEFSPQLAQRFARFRAEIARPRQIATARLRFAKEPERGPPPERLVDESDIALARRVESFCGTDAAGFFVEDAGHLSASREWAQARTRTLDGIEQMAETMGCVIQASFIAELEFSMPQAESSLAPM